MRAISYRFRCVVCAVVCVSLASTGLSSVTAVIQPTDDVCIDSAFPNKNYNNSTDNPKLIARHSYIGPSDTYSILKFDLSEIPNSATILGATLHLYCLATCDEYVYAYRVSDDNWDENTVTWNTYLPDTTDPAKSTYLDTQRVYVPSNGDYWETWNLMALNWQADLADNLLTLMLTADPQSSHYYSPANMASKEYELGSKIPYIEIEYTPEPASLTLMALGVMALLRRRVA
ncbi:MAG: DNRLRE domain-containing protein [Phycisphaerae bacterium]|nr:DNRLRE domain-containing protein [Phycisphaerae bacterium]